MGGRGWVGGGIINNVTGRPVLKESPSPGFGYGRGRVKAGGIGRRGTWRVNACVSFGLDEFR